MPFSKVSFPATTSRVTDLTKTGSSVAKGETSGLACELSSTRLVSHPGFVVNSLPLSASDEAQQHVENYPELQHLASSWVTATNEAAGGNAPSESYSSQLDKGQQFVEFERSLVSLQSLNQVIDGSDQAYARLTSVQITPALGYGDFKSLSNRWQTLAEHYGSKGIYPNDLRTTAEVSLVLGDMGKAKSVRDMMADLGIGDVDHNDFYRRVMSHQEAPKRFESFRRLNPDLQMLVRKTAGLAHFGHITHCEGGPQMFGRLKASDILNQDPEAFEFAAFVHICDVAGALGHRNPKGSAAYTKATFHAVEATFDACRALKDGDEVSAYALLIRRRAHWLGLSPYSDEGRMLTRLGALMRLVTLEHGQALKESFSKLSLKDRDMARLALSASKAGQTCRAPTYIPALLVNLANNRQLGNTVEERLMHAVKIGVPFISFTLNTYRSMLDQGSLRPDVPLNFNPLSGTAAVAPELLRSGTAWIDPKNGEVLL